MGKRGRPRKNTNQWRFTERKINGEMRKVQVRRKPNGREEIKIVYPKKRAITLDNKAKSLKGSAKASYLNAKRPKSASHLC